MIKIDNGYISYEGDRLRLNLELGILIREMYQKGIVNRDMLDELIRGAIMSDKELHEEAEKSRDKLIKSLEDKLNAINELQKILEAKRDDR